MRYFYIDTENISSKLWIESLSQMRKTDTVILFYTQNSNMVSIEQLAYVNKTAAKLEYIKVDNGIKNALDFVLVSELSTRAASASK